MTMAFEDIQKIANDMKDRCSTGAPFQLETLEPQDLYNFTLAATLYKYPKKPIKLRPYQMKPAWATVESVVKELGKEIIAEWSRQCVHKDSYITLNTGDVKKIKDIQVGEYVLSVHKNNEVTTNRVLKKWRSGVKKIYRVTTMKGHYLDVTADHKFLTPQGFVSIKDGLDIHKKVKINCHINSPNGMVGICRNGMFLNESNTPDKALILGYFLADGYCGKGQSPKFTNINSEYNGEFETLIKNAFDIDVKRYPKGNGEDLLITNGSHATGSNPFINWLREIGLYGKSGNDKLVPSFVFALDEYDTSLFLNRLYSADGWIRNGKRNVEIGLSAHCYHYAVQIRSLLSKFGILSYINKSNGKKSTKDFYKVRVSDKQSVITFFDKIGLIYGKEQRSQDAYDYAQSREKKCRGMNDSDVLFDFIKSIEFMGMKETYDLSIEHTENFIANGLIVHNSGKTTALPGATLHFLSALPSMFEPMDKGFNAGIFGPKVRQATYAFDMYKWFYHTNFMHDYLGIKHGKFNSQEVALNNGVRIFCETASPNARIESLTLDLAYCEEAQSITDTRLLSSIYPMCAATNGTRVLTGNPTEERIGHFYKMVSRLGPDVFIADYKEVMQYSPEYETYIQKQKIELGEQSDEFQTQYALNWVQVSSHFCTIEELTELRSGGMIYEMNSPVVVGCDPARINDSTVLTIMSMIGVPHICMWAEWRGDDWKTQASDITAILKSFPQVHAFNIDTLHGEGISDYLPQHIPVSRVPMEKHIQSWMWKQLRKAIKNTMFTYPEDEQPERYRFEDQVTSLLAKYVGNLYKVAGPSGRNKHDDYGDSLALTWLSFAGRPEHDPDAGKLEPIVPRRISRRPSAGRRPTGSRRPTSR